MVSLFYFQKTNNDNTTISYSSSSFLIPSDELDCGVRKLNHIEAYPNAGKPFLFAEN
jgi:hypothetical protein